MRIANTSVVLVNPATSPPAVPTTVAASTIAADATSPGRATENVSGNLVTDMGDLRVNLETNTPAPLTATVPAARRMSEAPAVPTPPVDAINWDTTAAEPVAPARGSEPTTHVRRESVVPTALVEVVAATDWLVNSATGTSALPAATVSAVMRTSDQVAANEMKDPGRIPSSLRNGTTLMKATGGSRRCRKRRHPVLPLVSEGDTLTGGGCYGQDM
jgi:hypothetical protein